MKRKLKPDDERIFCPEVGEILSCPKGTTFDMVFLRELGVEPWSSFNWIVWMLEGFPKEPKGMW